MIVATRFGRVIDASVNECAPDHSTHVIYVGELRAAVVEMEGLYEALEEARLIAANLPHGESLFLAKIDAAIAKARGQ